MAAIEQALDGLVRLATNARRPLPDPDTLAGFVPVLTRLESSRPDGIIMQKQADPMRPLDGGDSANRTGVLAFCGSKHDAEMLPRFFNAATSMAVRHPTQPPWDNPNNFSRDQLIGYVAGCWRAGRTDISKALLAAHEHRGFICQNFEDDAPGTKKEPPIGDPLGPQDIMYLRTCAGDTDAVSDIAGQLVMFTSIQFLSSDKKTEINQSLLQAIVCCQLDVFVKAHPNYKEQLIYYWEGEDGKWRQQREVADAWIAVVDRELQRYETPDIFDYLLPANILNELRHIDLKEALEALRTGNPAYFAELAGKLTVALLRDLKHAADVLVYTLRAALNVGEEIAVMALKALQSEVTKNLNKLDNFLKDLGPLHVVAIALKTAAGLLGLASSDDESARREELQFRQDVLLGLQTIQRDTKEILANVAKLQIDMEKNFAELAIRVDAGFYNLILNDITMRSQAVLSVINSLNARPGPKDNERRDLEIALNNSVIELATSMGKCTEYGAPAIPAAFHAYSILITSATMLNHPVQAKKLNDDYRPNFEEMLDGRKGLRQTIKTLDQVLADGYNAFDRVRNRILIGGVSVRRAEQRNMDDTKDINPADGFWRTKVYATLHGSIESGDWTVSFTPEDAGEDPLELSAAGGPAEPRVYSSAQFETAPWYGGRGRSKYHSPDFRELQINARDVGVRNVINGAGTRLIALLKDTREQVLNAKAALPGHRTLYAAVKATFDQPTAGNPAVRVAPIQALQAPAA